MQVLLRDGGLTFGTLSNTTVSNLSDITVSNLRNIFAISQEQNVPGHFIGIAVVSIVAGLFIPALKRRFEKRFRH